MLTAAYVVSALVALLHLWFLTLEMFLWQKPAGLRVFRNTPERASVTAVLAANQGLYNGFLAAGIVLGIVRGHHGFEMLGFMLACVVVAGVYGAATVSRRILFIQAVPAAIALVLMALALHT